MRRREIERDPCHPITKKGKRKESKRVIQKQTEREIELENERECVCGCVCVCVRVSWPSDLCHTEMSFSEKLLRERGGRGRTYLWAQPIHPRDKFDF